MKKSRGHYSRENFCMPFDIQFFASEGGDGGAEGPAGAEGAGTEGATGAEGSASTEGATGEKEGTGNSALTTEAIEKLIQSKVDKQSAELGKTIAQLKKENEKLKKDSLSAEELKNYEISEKEKALAEREKDLADREHRLFAIKAIKEIGLDDGSETSLNLVDFVVADSEEEITNRVKTIHKVVHDLVDARVNSKFKELGRTPNGAKSAETGKTQPSIAEKLGKQKAEQEKKSNEILEKYLGGRK